MILNTPKYPIDKSTPAFSIYRNHKRIESLESCRMEKAFLDIETALRGKTDITIVQSPTVKDPTETSSTTKELSFQRVYDHVKIPDDLRIKKIPVIISFQTHSYGNFAIIRNDESETSTKLPVDWSAIRKEEAERLIEEYHKSYPNLSNIEIFQKLYMTNFEADKEDFKKEIRGTKMGTKVYDYIIWAEQRKSK